jgi:adenine deaminase
MGYMLRRTPEERIALIGVASGLTEPDLVIKNANVYNPYTGAFQRGDLAAAGGRVAGVGHFEGGKTVVHADGRYLISGFIDGHVHVESSMASPGEFAKCLAVNGTSAAVADPHEIANVAGVAGVEWFVSETEDLPITVFVMAPSCVPATDFERGGAVLSKADIDRILALPRVLGLAEMMNFPGVAAGDPAVVAKMTEAPLIDGHSPGLALGGLTAYIGSGISTDHECSTPREAADRLRQGMTVLLRQGTAARNLLDLLPAVTPFTAGHCCLATDDRHAQDLVAHGSINHLVSLAAKSSGPELNLILNMATLNPAVHYCLADMGSLAPGKLADMALYPDLSDFRPDLVWKGGRLVAENGRYVGGPGTVGGGRDDPGGRDDRGGRGDGKRRERIEAAGAPGEPGGAGRGPALRDTVRLGHLKLSDLEVPATGNRIRVIGVIPGQIVTEDLTMTVEAVDSRYVSDPGKDLAKLAVWNRYGGEGPPAVGFIWGMGVKRGAIASTVSHDSHNLIACGVSDGDMLLCARTLAGTGGGLAAALDGEIVASLPLPLGGLMSEESLPKVADALEELRLAAQRLGFSEELDPFMTLSFMSLPVIPTLKLTCGGLLDTRAGAYVPVVFD